MVSFLSPYLLGRGFNRVQNRELELRWGSSEVRLRVSLEQYKQFYCEEGEGTVIL